MMRSLRHWIGAALLSQPFYAEEIRMVGLIAQVWRFRSPTLPTLRLGQELTRTANDGSDLDCRLAVETQKATFTTDRALPRTGRSFRRSLMTETGPSADRPLSWRHPSSKRGKRTKGDQIAEALTIPSFARAMLPHDSEPHPVCATIAAAAHWLRLPGGASCR